MTHVTVETAAPTVVEVTVGGFGLTEGEQFPGGLAPPGNLEATEVTENSLILGWTPSFDTSGVEAVGYNVYESVAGVDTLLASVIAPPYPITGLDPGSTHTYRVTPLTADGHEGAASTIGVQTTLAVDLTPPTDPSNLVADQTTNAATLTWDPSTDASGIGRYNVYLVVDAVDVLQGFVSETTFKITGLDSGVSYAAKVEAVDGVGNVSAKVSVGFTTDTPGDLTAPSAPTNFQSTSHTSSAIALSWDASVDPIVSGESTTGVDYYEITSGFTVIATTTATSKTLPALIPATKYVLNIRAVDKAGNRSAFAGAIQVTTDSATDTTPPSPPLNLRFGTITQTSIQVLWDAPGDGDVAGYDLYQHLTVIAQPATTSYTIPNLQPGTSYSVNLKAFDTSGLRSGFAGAIVTSTTAAPTATTWPPKNFTGGFGTTLNNRPYKVNGVATTKAYRWKDAADALHSAMSHPGQWNVARIQVDMGTLEPNHNNVYVPGGGDVADKVDWCYNQTPSIRPILLLTFPPPDYTIKLKYTNCTVSNVGGKARITCPDFDSGWNYQSLSAHGTGIPEGTGNYVPLGGQGSGYVDLAVAATSVGSGRTIVFGGGGNPNASADDHLWVAKGTGYDPATFIDEGTVDHRIDLAKSAAYVAAHFGYANPIIEYGNESNGDHGRRPSGNPVDRYIDELMYVYRAVKEYDPSVPILFTGVNNNTSTSEGARSLDGPKFLRLAWQRMRTNTKWNNGTGGGWVNSTTFLLKSSNTPTGFPGVGRYTMASALAAGTVSPRYWVDYAGWHAYSITRPGNGSVGDDNYSYWSDRDLDEDGGGAPGDNHFGTGARFVRMLNDIHTESTQTNADPNIDDLMFICTETFPPWHPLAKTGVGGRTSEGFDGSSDAVNSNRYCASSEEAGVQLYMLKRFVHGKRNWATGGSIPAYTGPGDPAARWAAINGQWITETPQTYQAAANFFFQGFWTDVAIGTFAAGKLKVAVGADATGRQNLKDGKTHDGDSHFFSNANFPAAVVDAVTAFDEKP